MKKFTENKLLFFLIGISVTAISLLFLWSKLNQIWVTSNPSVDQYTNSDKDQEIYELRSRLSEISADVDITGYIEQHFIESSTKNDFYGNPRVLLAAVSNYYFDPSINNQKLTQYEESISSLGWVVRTPDDFIESGDTETCYRKDGISPKSEICMFTFSKILSSDFIGGGTDQIWVGHDNEVETSKPFNMILSAREY